MARDPADPATSNPAVNEMTVETGGSNSIAIVPAIATLAAAANSWADTSSESENERSTLRGGSDTPPRLGCRDCLIMLAHDSFL